MHVVNDVSSSQNPNLALPKVVLFDMDGTLLDLHFDSFIWLECVPKQWAELKKCTLLEATQDLIAFYQRHHGTLRWYSTRFWHEQLGIDIMALQRQYRARIAPRPHCFELLTALQQRHIDCWLVTNADESTLALKLETIALRPYFKVIISSERTGYAKEQANFWQYLVDHHQLSPQDAWLLDDNGQVLTSAAAFGIKTCFGITRPDMQREAHRLATPAAHYQFDHLTDLLHYLPDPILT